jgi:hypothetical protein
VKKGRHRRFEEARKLKQSGPGEFVFSDFVDEDDRRDADELDSDEYEDLARKYGALDDDDEEPVED